LDELFVFLLILKLFVLIGMLTGRGVRSKLFFKEFDPIWKALDFVTYCQKIFRTCRRFQRCSNCV